MEPNDIIMIYMIYIHHIIIYIHQIVIYNMFVVYHYGLLNYPRLLNILP